jgi:hypothetical protein
MGTDGKLCGIHLLWHLLYSGFVDRGLLKAWRRKDLLGGLGQSPLQDHTQIDNTRQTIDLPALD